MGNTIFVINPNSSAVVTDAIDRAVEPLRLAGGPAIKCLTLKEGPPGIETQHHVDGVVDPLCRLAAALEEDAAAFVIACFSDPGLHSLREQSRRLVLGISECSMLTALTLGQRFGIIAILPTSVPRHLRYIGAMGLRDRFAGDRPLQFGVAELADGRRAFARMIEVGKALRDTDGADVVVLGCAGMANHRDTLSEALRMPVVEPTQAAVAMAVGRVRLEW